MTRVRSRASRRPAPSSPAVRRGRVRGGPSPAPRRGCRGSRDHAERAPPRAPGPAGPALPPLPGGRRRGAVPRTPRPAPAPDVRRPPGPPSARRWCPAGGSGRRGAAAGGRSSPGWPPWPCWSPRPRSSLPSTRSSPSRRCRLRAGYGTVWRCWAPRSPPPPAPPAPPWRARPGDSSRRPTGAPWRRWSWASTSRPSCSAPWWPWTRPWPPGPPAGRPRDRADRPLAAGAPGGSASAALGGLAVALVAGPHLAVAGAAAAARPLFVRLLPPVAPFADGPDGGARPGDPGPGQPGPGPGPGQAEPAAADPFASALEGLRPEGDSAGRPVWDGTSPLNVLLLGTDRRPGEAAVQRWGNSDTIILVSVDPARGRVAMVSVPRDVLVPVPGAGEQKVNAAYLRGGPPLAVRVVGDLLGLPVHRWASVDTSAFEAVVDAVGGVVVDVERPLRDDDYPTEDYGVRRIRIAAGLQWLDGERALWFARSRHETNDYDRAGRQQRLLRALQGRARDPSLLPRVPALLGVVAGAVQTDVSPREAVALARLAAGRRRGHGRGGGRPPGGPRPRARAARVRAGARPPRPVRRRPRPGAHPAGRGGAPGRRHGRRHAGDGRRRKGGGDTRSGRPGGRRPGAPVRPLGAGGRRVHGRSDPTRRQAARRVVTGGGRARDRRRGDDPHAGTRWKGRRTASSSSTKERPGPAASGNRVRGPTASGRIASRSAPGSGGSTSRETSISAPRVPAHPRRRRDPEGSTSSVSVCTTPWSPPGRRCAASERSRTW